MANNPVNNSDPSGCGIIKNAIKWIAKNVIKPAVIATRKALSKVNTTYSKGINVSAGFGFDFSGSAGITTDCNGNIGIILTGCNGGGTPAASACLYKTITTAPDIYKQRGMNEQIGGSADVIGVNIGAEYTLFQDTKTNQIYHGFTEMVGFGAPIPAELHGEIGYSFVIYGINVYDVMKSIYKKIMDW